MAGKNTAVFGIFDSRVSAEMCIDNPDDLRFRKRRYLSARARSGHDTRDRHGKEHQSRPEGAAGGRNDRRR